MKPRILIMIAIVGLVVAACGGEGADTTTAGGEVTTTTGGAEQTTTTSPETTTSVGATTSTVEMMEGVHASETDLGTILVDPEGFTLYVFTVDTGGESTCYDDCAALWPPVPASTDISPDLDASIFGSTTRTDGTQQLTVNGMPLYRYNPDTSPGDTNGQGFSGVWFVVDIEGNMIEASAGDSALGDYGY